MRAPAARSSLLDMRKSARSKSAHRSPPAAPEPRPPRLVRPHVGIPGPVFPEDAIPNRRMSSSSGTRAASSIGSPISRPARPTGWLEGFDPASSNLAAFFDLDGQADATLFRVDRDGGATASCQWRCPGGERGLGRQPGGQPRSAPLDRVLADFYVFCAAPDDRVALRLYAAHDP